MILIILIYITCQVNVMANVNCDNNNNLVAKDLSNSETDIIAFTGSYRLRSWYGLFTNNFEYDCPKS